MNEEIKHGNLRIHSRADELIACLEGEIAKRDETIARLEADNRSKNGSLKAFGEQIAGLQKAVRNRERLVGLRDARILELEAKYLELASLSSRVSVELPIAYAAPVSEAKAQGVVMPEREEFEGVYSAEYGTPVSVLKLLREGENYIEKPQHSDRLNSSWWMWQKACARLNAAPVQRVSVPQCVLDWFEAKQAHVTAADAYNARLAFVREHMPFGTSVNPEYQIMEEADRKVRNLVWPMFSGLRDLYAAPAAPAADAGLVEAIDWLDDFVARCNGDDRGSCDSVNIIRAALAAHRAKGVV